MKRNIYLVAASLLTASLAYAQCELDSQALELIQSEPLLNTLHQLNQQISPVPDCTFVEGLTKKVATVMEQTPGLSELMPHCQLRTHLALDYVQQMNQNLEQTCKDQDCSDLLTTLTQNRALTVLNQTLYLRHPNFEASTHQQENDKVGFSAMSWSGQTLFERCGQMKIQVFNFEKPFTDKINSILHQTLEPMIQTLKEGKASAQQTFAKLQQENYFDYTIEQKLLWQSPSLLTVETFNYVFTGGAHGLSGKSFHNFDLNTGQVLHLEDLFEIKHKDTLLALTEKALKNWHDKNVDNTFETQEEDLLEMGFIFNPEYIPPEHKAWANKEGLYLTDNFYVTDEGLHLVYNPYEIGPYAFGMIDIMLSWSQLDSLLKPSAVSQMLNE